jgi:rubrerythrin
LPRAALSIQEDRRPDEEAPSREDTGMTIVAISTLTPTHRTDVAAGKVRKCRQCGTELARTVKRCPSCGQPLSAHSR